MNKNNKEGTSGISLGAMLAVFVIIILIIVFYINKKREKEALEKLKQGLISRKEILEELKRNTEKKVQIIYTLFKTFIVGIFFTVCFYIYKIPHENFVQYFDNCLTFFGAIGIALLIICFLIEENPIDIFRFRNIMKTKIYNLLFAPIQSQIDEIPQIEESILATNSLIKIIDTEIQ